MIRAAFVNYGNSLDIKKSLQYHIIVAKKHTATFTVAFS